jgi:hypothetical protein
MNKIFKVLFNPTLVGLATGMVIVNVYKHCGVGYAVAVSLVAMFSFMAGINQKD